MPESVEGAMLAPQRTAATRFPANCRPLARRVAIGTAAAPSMSEWCRLVNSRKASAMTASVTSTQRSTSSRQS